MMDAPSPFSNNPLINAVSDWCRRNFADPAAVSLFFSLVVLLLLFEFFGGILVPILVSIALASVLHSLAASLERLGFQRLPAIVTVFSLFIAFFILILVVFVPLLWRQLFGFTQDLPRMFLDIQNLLNQWARHYPGELGFLRGEELMQLARQEMSTWWHYVLAYSLTSIPSLIAVVLYFVLVPILAFFFLKDQAAILQWFSQYLPKNRYLIKEVWSEVLSQIGLYIQGRIIEIFIIGVAASLLLALLGLHYALLIGAGIGVSVIVPYVGAAVSFIPVVVTALFQWGFSFHAFYVIAALLILMLFDANVLVPLLFAQTLDLHPVVIILSILVFGAIWGFWGVFFGIPLATLIKAILEKWPKGTK